MIISSSIVVVPCTAPRASSCRNITKPYVASALLVRRGQATLYARKCVRPHQHIARATDASPTTANAEPTVEEVMVPNPFVLKSSMTCKEAARLLIEADVSGAPVVDDKGKLVGILSESDLVWKGAGVPLEHTIFPTVFIGAFDLLITLRDNKLIEQEVQKIVARTVADAMSKEVVTVPPSASMSDAAHLMLEKKVSRLPVVEDGKLVGILTKHDVLRGMVAANSPML